MAKAKLKPKFKKSVRTNMRIPKAQVADIAKEVAKKAGKVVAVPVPVPMQVKPPPIPVHPVDVKVNIMPSMPVKPKMNMDVEGCC